MRLDFEATGDRTKGIMTSIFSIFVVAALASGCATNGPKPTANLQDVITRESAAKKKVEDLNQALFASVSSAPLPQDYLVGEGDLLQVTVFEAEELKTEARVGARGSITLPLLGAVDVKGLTAREAEQKIEDAYRERYIQDPHVNIFVKEQHGSKVTLLGEVKNPGTYDYFSRQRLLDVLAIGGGLTEKAGMIVQVRRASDDPSQPSTFLIDLDQLARKGMTELNLEIQGGDVLFVPEAGMVYVDGAVRKPGNYPITKTMTVQQAIVAAGGFSSTASEGDIKLVRFDDSGRQEVVQLSAADLQQAASDLEVRDRDIIFVETSRLEALIYGLRLNLGMGLVGVGYNPPPQ